MDGGSAFLGEEGDCSDTFGELLRAAPFKSGERTDCVSLDLKQTGCKTADVVYERKCG